MPTPLLPRENGFPRNSSRPGTASSKGSDSAGPSSPIPGYTLGDCLGKGAFASVYKALNWTTGETVAVKQIRLADLQKSELRVIMLEIDLLKNLNHPNIVKYKGFVKTTDSLYIILEYCENGSLHNVSKNFGKFPENLVVLYMTQVLYGLLYLHDQGVIHRDIKGANILTTKEGLVKLADFGVATRAGVLSDSTVVGTPYWMAPEVIELAGASTASDIWSLGCTVIELLDGKPPYHKLQSMQALFRIVNDDHPPLPESASPAVHDFLMQCFQKDPNLRVTARKLLRHPWIVNAKRAESVVRASLTQQEEAIKTIQKWNEALKSQNAGTLRKPPRVISASPNLKPQSETTTLVKGGQPSRVYPDPETFRSPDPAEDEDNWDRDFDNLSPSVLRLPQNKLNSKLGGLSHSEGPKSFAPIDGAQENWDDSFEGFWHDDDPMQTIRPVNRTASIKKTEESRVFSRSPEAPISNQRPPLSAPSKQALLPKQKKLVLPSRPALQYKEDTLEDYEDLVGDNATFFEQKVDFMQRDAHLNPKLFHPSDLKSLPRPPSSSKSKAGSLRRHLSVIEAEKDPHSMRRSRSSLEIEKYVETDGEEDYSDVFGKDSASEMYDSDASRDEFLTKLSHNSWLGDEENDEDDPFAMLEEGFDEADLEANIARDRYARLCGQVGSLVDALKTTQPEDTFDKIATQLMDVLLESSDIKDIILSAHGMLPILEVLEIAKRREVILKLLKIVNAIICDDQEVQENICFVGGIPIITKFASKKYASNIRLEAAAFVRQMYQTSTLTLQMFVSSGGLNVLVEFLEEDYEAKKELVLIGINGIWRVFELQGPTPKNDFCRIFARSAVLQPLSLTLGHVLEEDGELAHLCVERIVNIFYIFSQAENHVKETIAERSVLKRVLKDLKRMSPPHQITVLKFIKNLSMLSTTLDTLQNANAIEVLTDLLDASRHGSHFKEISNQILNTMYNLCKLSKSRQEEAASMGIIPILQKIVETERPLKEFALPILCDMAHCSKISRKILWQNHGLQFYISLLLDPYWQVTALDAIFAWLQEETGRVEEKLLTESCINTIVKCFTTSKANSFENLLEPLQKLLELSLPIAHAVARPEFCYKILQKLSHHKPVVRLNLLRILRTICNASEQQEGLIRQYNMTLTIQKLAEKDPSDLVQNLAWKLLRSPTQLQAEGQLPVIGTAAIASKRRIGHKRAISNVSRSSTPSTAANSIVSMPPGTLQHQYEVNDKTGADSSGRRSSHALISRSYSDFGHGMGSSGEQHSLLNIPGGFDFADGDEGIRSLGSGTGSGVNPHLSVSGTPRKAFKGGPLIRSPSQQRFQSYPASPSNPSSRSGHSRRTRL